MVRIEKQSFEKAVEHLIATGTRQARQRVWDYIAAMPTLYFVQCGQRSRSVPWIMFLEDVPTAMVFTEYERAKQAASSIIEQNSEVRIVGLPTNAASMYITALAAQGVECVCFNHGPNRFDATIDEVLLSIKSMKR